MIPAFGKSTKTTCPYCGVGCGVVATPSKDGLSVKIEGDPEHPANFGRLCSKGSSLGKTLGHKERLLFPSIGGERCDWEEAISHVAKGFRETIDSFGSESVAFYVSGQILTEDYYVANKLMKGFIGTGNIDTNSRLCMASSVVGHKRAFGTDTVPGCYDDLEQADLVVIVGSNLAWCHPVLNQRLSIARQTRGTKIVVVDPRATATTEDCDLHLAVKPGSDVALFNGLLAHLIANDAVDSNFIENHTNGFDEIASKLERQTLSSVSDITGVKAKSLKNFYELYAKTPRVVTIYSQGVNQSSRGSDKVNAILNSHLATGRIGKVGCGPFSVTGQPNAMGGREVGGLANQLACHMDYAPEDVDRVKRFWNSPNIASKPGLKAIDMFDAVADGRIKAIWIMATNPVVSLPDADRVQAALKACPLVVVSEVSNTTDIAQYADVLLPATAWGEKTGTVTNSERRISRQRSFLSPPGEARHDWQALCEVAKKMGYSEFDYSGPEAIFTEYAALSAFENENTRDFNIGAYSEISRDEYDELVPFQWPAPTEGSLPGSSESNNHRFFGDGLFYTDDRKAKFLLVDPKPAMGSTSSSFPLILNTGRIKDHWHTMTRTGLVAGLSEHTAEPFVEIHPETAMKNELQDYCIAKVISKRGSVKVRVSITDRVAKDDVFVPMHWTDRYTSQGRVDTLVAPHTDPLSGQPESKFTPVRVRPLSLDWYGFAVLVKEPSREWLSNLEYWALAPAEHGWRVEMAGQGIPDEKIIELLDAQSMQTLMSGNRLKAVSAFDDEGYLEGAAFLSDNPVAADRTWLSSKVGTLLDPIETINILAGRPGSGCSEGRTICACMGVSTRKIEQAIDAGSTSVEGIGDATGAGTNCGSCKPDIRKILKAREALTQTNSKLAAE